MKEDQRAIERPTQFDDTCSQVTGDVARSAIIPSEGPLTADPLQQLWHTRAHWCTACCAGASLRIQGKR